MLHSDLTHINAVDVGRRVAVSSTSLVGMNLVRNMNVGKLCGV